MSEYLAWIVFALGLGHIVTGLIWFRAPLAAAVADGLFDRFKAHESRRTAFWFLIFGPLLMLAGQLGVHAVATGDMAALKLVGGYLLAVSIAGVAAFPKSPFLLALPIAVLLLAQGFGMLP